jgi:hypothetical protein
MRLESARKVRVMRIDQKIAVVAGLVVSEVLVGGVSTSGLKSDSPTSQTSSFAPASHTSVSADEVGKELFRGIVFGQGSTARKLGMRPSLAAFYYDQYSQNNTASSTTRADTIINDIAPKDPRYFTEFGSAIRSGNPFVVTSALDDVEPRLRAENVSLDSVHASPQCGTSFA